MTTSISNRGMDGLGCLVVSLMGYSCGPSQVIGIVATPACTIAWGTSRVTQLYYESCFHPTTEDEHKLLEHKINYYKKKTEQCYKLTKFFSLAMIPVIGGPIAAMAAIQ